MAKIITQYQCEICKERYEKEPDAIECESKGIPDLISIGTIFSMGVGDMVFAVIKQLPNQYGHHHGYLTWGCRDTDAGDNAEGEHFCGFESWDKIYPPNKKIPAYKRMIKALQKTKIKPIE